MHKTSAEYNNYYWQTNTLLPRKKDILIILKFYHFIQQDIQ